MAAATYNLCQKCIEEYPPKTKAIKKFTYRYFVRFSPINIFLIVILIPQGIDNYQPNFCWYLEP
jgi:hypothetical protein